MKATIFLLILLCGCSITTFSQNRTQISNITIDEARWGQQGAVGVYFSYTLTNPALYNNSYKRYIEIVGEKRTEDYYQPASIEYSSDNLYKTWMSIPKNLISLNSTIQIKMRFFNLEYQMKGENYDKIPGNWNNPLLPKFIEGIVSFELINNNGFVEVKGVKNINPHPVSNENAQQLSGETGIEIEKNNATGVAYTGVAADGTSSIRINLSGISGDKVKFEIPYGMGALKYKGGIQAYNEPKIDQYISLSNGAATVFFHPPKYLDPDLITSRTEINGRQVWCINAPIRFTYKDAAGNIQSQTIKISILRPMVFLVHGFTGDASTWSGLANNLATQKFDSRAENYYEQNDGFLIKSQDVFAQSRKLSENIDDAKSEYSKSNIKMLKVDIVAHSMGGLIARYYTNGYSSYRNDVRKLFMVGTPNHGIGNGKQILGAFGAAGTWSHFGMLADVHEESDFMVNLNRNESTGGHLNKDIEYFNIYGTFDDGVTHESSAYMPGVMSYKIKKCCHSPSPDILLALGTPLTIHPEVYSQVSKYLQNEITRVPLKNVKAEIISTKGEVWVDRGTENLQVPRIPYKVSPYYKIRTLEKSAVVISFTMDGKEWGRLVTGQNTSLHLKYFSPQTFTVRVVKGKARFSTDGSHFNVEIMPDNYNKLEWYTFSPKVDINGLGTTYEVIYENGIAQINLIEGEIRLDDNVTNTFKNISTPQTMVVNQSGQINSQALQIDNELKQLDAEAPPKMQPNPLFANVTIGGTSWVGGSGNDPRNPPSANKTQSCIDQLQVQFIQKTGAVNDPQARMMAMKLDDENKREMFWFNQAAENYRRNVLPREMSGTYRKQQSPSVFNRSYYSETITLFEPMKITNTTGNSHGFSLMKDSREYKRFNTNQEAEGVVLPCGSYKVYPSDDLPFATTKFQLIKNQ